MKKFPEIMRHPHTAVIIEYYQIKFGELLAQIGQNASDIDEQAIVTTILAASLGAMDAAIKSLIAFHTSDQSAFDVDEFSAMLRRRVDLCYAFFERIRYGGASNKRSHLGAIAGFKGLQRL